jgi:hypothetical protein
MKAFTIRPRGGRPSQGHRHIDWRSLRGGYSGRSDRDRLAQMVSSGRARAAELGCRSHFDRLSRSTKMSSVPLPASGTAF